MGDVTLILVADDGSHELNPQNLIALRAPASLFDEPEEAQD